MEKILIITDDLAEDLELLYPYYRLKEAGYEVILASDVKGKKMKGKYGVPYESDISWDDISSNDFIGVLIPGGWAPDKMRRFDKVKELIKEFDKANKPIGIICHAGWVTISAGIMKGKVVTSTPGIKDDIINSGAEWIDKTVVVDKNIISSRKPGDLPNYMKEFLKQISK